MTFTPANVQTLKMRLSVSMTISMTFAISTNQVTAMLYFIIPAIIFSAILEWIAGENE